LNVWKKVLLLAAGGARISRRLFRLAAKKPMFRNTPFSVGSKPKKMWNTRIRDPELHRPAHVGADRNTTVRKHSDRLGERVAALV
jgi:hypothetical protein